jgi:hypothetical protein
MKRIITSVLILLCGIAGIAQTIPNGDFETWIEHTWLDPNDLNSGNPDAISMGLSPTITRTIDKQSGNYAIKLETLATSQDTMFGYVLWGLVQEMPTNGVTYTQKPDAITGYYKYNIQANDSALLAVWFWDGGIIVSSDMFYIKGTQNTFTKFQFPLTLLVTPDSVTVGFTSSEPFNEGVAKPGSWIIFDSIAFTGTGITQQLPNYDFENWSTISVEDPLNWASFNLTLYSRQVTHLQKTTDSNTGNYALSLKTFEIIDEVGTHHYIGSTFLGSNIYNSYNSGVPYTLQSDTLIFFYKYTPMPDDSASVSLMFLKDGNYIYTRDTVLSESANYTKIKLPFSLWESPDTMQLYINSSHEPNVNFVGSELKIDDIYLISDFATRVRKVNPFAGSLFPNPASKNITCSFYTPSDGGVEITIFDISGKPLLCKALGNYTRGNHQPIIDISNLRGGIYMYEIRSKHKSLSKGKFIKQ